MTLQNDTKIAHVETNATAFEFNPWLMREIVFAVLDIYPDVTEIKVYRDGGHVCSLGPETVGKHRL
jgi:hypothetical protein